MEIGSLHQKASPAILGFVCICLIVTFGILFVTQKSVILGQNLAVTTSE